MEFYRQFHQSYFKQVIIFIRRSQIKRQHSIKYKQSKNFFHLLHPSCFERSGLQRATLKLRYDIIKNYRFYIARRGLVCDLHGDVNSWVQDDIQDSYIPFSCENIEDMVDLLRFEPKPLKYGPSGNFQPISKSFNFAQGIINKEYSICLSSWRKIGQSYKAWYWVASRAVRRSVKAFTNTQNIIQMHRNCFHCVLYVFAKITICRTWWSYWKCIQCMCNDCRPAFKFSTCSTWTRLRRQTCKCYLQPCPADWWVNNYVQRIILFQQLTKSRISMRWHIYLCK